MQRPTIAPIGRVSRGRGAGEREKGRTAGQAAGDRAKHSGVWTALDAVRTSRNSFVHLAELGRFSDRLRKFIEGCASEEV